jgi:hypothetical protein
MKGLDFFAIKNFMKKKTQKHTKHTHTYGPQKNIFQVLTSHLGSQINDGDWIFALKKSYGEKINQVLTSHFKISNNGGDWVFAFKRKPWIKKIIIIVKSSGLNILFKISNNYGDWNFSP